MSEIVDEFGINQIYKTSEVNNLRQQRRINKICEYLPVSTSNVLEIGCGFAELSFEIQKNKNIKVTAIDQSADFINKNKSKHMNVHFIQAELIHYFTQSNEKFDAIVGMGILHHLLPEDPQFYLKLKNKLNPKGRILFWEPNLYCPLVFLIFKFAPLRKVFRLDEKEMALSLNNTRNQLTQAGFDIIELKFQDFLLPNTPKVVAPMLIKLGVILERHKLTAWMAQSLFICAQIK